MPKDKPSYKKAVVAYCKECGYDDGVPGTWRQQIEDCSITSCPLHPVRPVTLGTRRQRRADNKAGNIAVKEIEDLKS